MAAVIVLIFSLGFILCISFCLIKQLYSKTATEKALIHTIIAAGCSKDSIEGTFRLVINDIISSYEACPKVVIVDYDPFGEASLAAKILERQYDFVHVMTVDDYKEFLNTL